MIPDGCFKYIYHVGCAINSHSIINSGLIPGRSKFEQQTENILLACGSYGQNKRILRRSTWKHRVLHNSCTNHGRNIKNTVYWVDINLALRKGCEVLSDTIERHHFSGNTPSLLYPESCSDGNWRSHKREYMRHFGLLQRFP